MKRKIFIIGLFVTFIFAQNSYSQVINRQIYTAFLSNSPEKFLEILKPVERTANLNNANDRLTLAHYYYLYTSMLLEKDQDKEAEIIMAKTEKLLNSILKEEPKNAVALCYKGVFTSYQIRLNKLKALSLGKKAMANINEAYALEPNNVQIVFDKGNALYYPPKVFGGNKQEALKFFQKAISIIERQKNTSQNWIYLQLLLLEGKCYEANENWDAAEKSYQKALKLEPNFKVLREKVYPEFKEKTKRK